MCSLLRFRERPSWLLIWYSETCWRASRESLGTVDVSARLGWQATSAIPDWRGRGVEGERRRAGNIV